jgi:Dolichyl-phosphate-mannose-protein mannosyltransferase
MNRWLRRNSLVLGYVACAVTVILGYVRYDPYQIDGDAISYMDIASSLVHRRWHEAINGLWNPGYPIVLAIAKEITRAGRMQELQVFYWANFLIFVASLGCASFFVWSLLSFRARTIAGTQPRDTWVLPDPLVYLVSYGIVLQSWLHEFSPGKIRVDGLFATLLLLAFGCIIRILDTRRVLAYLGAGLFLGLAYLVKSPGLVIALVTMPLLVFVLYQQKRLKDSVWKLSLMAGLFLLACGPYIAALSLQKHRFDAGDSARLNYAWLVDGTEPQHLLNNQSYRFGNSRVELKHSEIELMANPVVLSFNRFPDATYAPWFDPSFFNEGIEPHFSLVRQIRLTATQARHLILFFVNHSFILILLVLCAIWGTRSGAYEGFRQLLFMFYCLFSFCILMYTSVHFLDRYIAGLLWPACIITLAVFVTTDSRKRGMISGAAVFMSLAILLSGAQTVIRMRQSVIFSGKTHGWYSTAEYGTARELPGHGVTPGSVVSCYRACNTGPYWARLAGVRITSEIYDPKYMSDAEDGNSSWSKLPNKSGIFQALKATGSKGIIGLFERTPNASEGWEHLEGLYYFHPL